MFSICPIDSLRELAQIGALKDVRVSKKDPVGLVGQIQLRGSITHIDLAGTLAVNLLKPHIKSRTFSLKHQREGKESKIICSGLGYGHQLGLCQYGARELVRRGWNHKQILKFYYPGTTFATIQRT